ncbi:hypothetical protein CDAR_304601 [Caerostris darwini]|uniref:Uncharacterized protein n=1 Tax=Caerostris darwini TaxID=1538125 RepID=A0AAV4NN47_9ARAC|nr:hypothetical protein CDAR_304601 [Caerostris darwini]
MDCNYQPEFSPTGPFVCDNYPSILLLVSFVGKARTLLLPLIVCYWKEEEQREFYSPHDKTFRRQLRTPRNPRPEKKKARSFARALMSLSDTERPGDKYATGSSRGRCGHTTP